MTSGTLASARLALASGCIPCDSPNMGLLPGVADDEVSIDDLLAGVRTTAELNAMIREGLVAAERGETGESADDLRPGPVSPVV